MRTKTMSFDPQQDGLPGMVGYVAQLAVALVASAWIAIAAAGSAFALGALTGFHLFLKSRKEFTARAVAYSVLSSALFSLASAALLFGVLPIEKWTWQAYWIAIFLSLASGPGTNIYGGAIIEAVITVLKLRTGGK